MKRLYSRISRTRVKEGKSLEGQIGIFLGKSQWEKFKSQELPEGLLPLVQASKELGIKPLWFTLPNMEQYTSGFLKGAILREGECHIEEYPFPKVIYDRATFSQKQRKEAIEFRNYLTQSGVEFVNSRGTFSKWGTYKVLSKNSELVPNLPKTIHFCRTFDLEELFREFNSIYVKSNWGSRGKEVIALTKKESGFDVAFPKGTVEEYLHFKDVTLAIYRFLGNKDVIAQEGINLASWRGRIFDIRVLAQKVTLTDWDCTGIVLRFASQGKKTTNISQGGTVMESEAVLEELWPGKSQGILKAIKDKSIEICQTLEARYGRLGELGLDLGLDRSGKAWLIEVNGKPAKSTIRKILRDDLIQLAYKRPLIYAQLLLKGANP
jgi:hypothetical protein